MSTAPKYIPNYLVSDYQQWDGNWELLDGVAIAMGPSPFGAHQVVCSRLIHCLTEQLDRNNCHCVVVPEIDWIVDRHTVVRPDIVIVCDGVPEKHVERPPSLIIEILSDSTREKDRSVKKELYQSQGVRHYLLVEPTAKTIEVFELADGQYRLLPQSDRYDIRLTEDCSLELNNQEVFR